MGGEYVYPQSTRCFPPKVDYQDEKKEVHGVFDENVLLEMFESGEIGWAQLCSYLGKRVTDTIKIGKKTITWV